MQYRELICGRMCRYFKPEKHEDPGCGGVEWLKPRTGLDAALSALQARPSDMLHGLDPNDPRLWVVCNSCEFRIDGCDFRDPEVAPEDCEPCGGLRAVAGLLAARVDVGL